MGEENTQENEVQHSVEEEKAIASGWRPQEEWEGAPDEWVTAKEYNFRGELMGRISKQGKELGESKAAIAELNTALKEMGKINKKTAEREYKKALADLKQQKVAALDEGDSATVVEVDEQIAEMNKAYEDMGREETAQQDAQVQPDPAVAKWLSDPKNDWYHNNVAMRGAADAIADQLAAEGVAPAEMLTKVEETMKQTFPQAFNKPVRQAPVVNDPAQRGSGGKGKKVTASSLNAEQKKVAHRLVESGAFETVQEYVDQLAELGEIS